MSAYVMPECVGLRQCAGAKQSGCGHYSRLFRASNPACRLHAIVGHARALSKDCTGVCDPARPDTKQKLRKEDGAFETAAVGQTFPEGGSAAETEVNCRRLVVIFALSAAVWCGCPATAVAHVPTEHLISYESNNATSTTRDNVQLFQPAGRNSSSIVNYGGRDREVSVARSNKPSLDEQTLYASSSLQQSATSSVATTPRGSTAERAADAIQQLAAARTATDLGDYEEALATYTRLIQLYPDLALTEYARIGRALLLYQVGSTSDAILELQDEEVSMKGSAEVHAAMAAMLYAERPRLQLRAEEEWDFACTFDRRYSDTQWVQAQKHWPPKLLVALQRFLALQ